MTDLLPQIFDTWPEQLPKVHFSSPRDLKNPRNHADFLEPGPAAEFLKATQTLGRDYDLMLEAKQKDLALLKLVADLKALGFNLPTPGKIVL